MGILASVNNKGNVQQILLSRYFREELKQRIQVRGLSPGKPLGVLLSYTRLVFPTYVLISTLLKNQGGTLGRSLQLFLSSTLSSLVLCSVNFSHLVLPGLPILPLQVWDTARNHLESLLLPKKICVPDAQWGQINQHVGVWSREGFIARPSKENG